MDFLNLVSFLEIRGITYESRWLNLSGDIHRLIKWYNHQIVEISAI